MSLLDGLIGSGNGSVTVKTDGVELPRRQKVNFTSDGSIDVDGADATDTSNVTLKHANTGGGALHSTATTASHGFHSSTDKKNHDALWSAAVVVTPSGDTTGVTDQANFNAALAITTKGVRPGPGTFYIDGGGADTSKLKCLDLTGRRGATFFGSGAECTEIIYVGPRVPGRMMLCLDSCTSCHVKGIKFSLGLLEKAGTEVFNPGQPTGNVVEHCWFWGPSSSVIRGTSTTNVTVGAGTKALTTQAGLGAYLVSGSKCLVVSRGTGERFYGTVTYSGTSLSVVVASDRDCMIDPLLGSHAHTDWDILIPPEGFTCTSAGSRISQNWFARTWGVARYDGCFRCICEYNFYSFNTMYGIPITAGISTSSSYFSGPIEPDAYGWGTLADIRESIACHAHIETGDGGLYGPHIKTVSSSCLRITGAAQAAGIGNNSSAVQATGTDRLIVDGLFYSTPYAVDFGTTGATNNHPQVINCVPFGSVSGVITGTQYGGNYNVQQSDLSPYQSAMKHDVATITTLSVTSAPTSANHAVRKTELDGVVAGGLRWFNKAAPGTTGTLFVERSGVQASAVEATSQRIADRAFTATYFAFNCATALATDTITATVRKNGVDTALTFSIPAGTGPGTVISDAAHSVSFARGDLISIKVVQSGSTAQASWYGEFVLG